MTNIPAGLIPFDYEKYKTGNYIAETRGGYRPDEVLYLKGCNSPVVYKDKENYAVVCEENGTLDDLPLEEDLFLRPKTVKKWQAVLSGWQFDTKEACEQYWKESHAFLKAIEVELPIDQIK